MNVDQHNNKNESINNNSLDHSKIGLTGGVYSGLWPIHVLPLVVSSYRNKEGDQLGIGSSNGTGNKVGEFFPPKSG